MYQRRLVLAFLLAVGLCGCRRDHDRLDITFEGPWIYFVEPDYNSSHHAALIAIAPQVPGHHNAVVSAGNGVVLAQLDDKSTHGLFCIGFDGACSPQRDSKSASLKYKPYANPRLVSVAFSHHSKNQDWVNLAEKA